MESLGISLALLGAVSLVAAITNGLHFINVEIPALTSPALRWTLAIVGLAFLYVGFAVRTEPPTSPGDGPRPTAIPATVQPTSSVLTSESVPTAKVPPSTIAVSYSQRAMTFCAASVKEIKALGTPATDEDYLNRTFDLAAILEQLGTKLDSLTPQAPDPNRHAQLLSHLSSTAQSLDSAGIALRAGDLIGYQQHLTNGDQFLADFNRVATRLSLNNCQIR
ncbi:hypothetical protein [Kribbella ginsengisoli]|uniref:Uncharacterized protein n=1 Tax=Kribbella ginsengisoli TaxID=363865 RepID=A0ABP6VJH2_9ACTN